MEQKISSAASGVTYTASGVTVVAGGLSFSEWMMLGGFLLGLCTFAINWYYQHKRIKILERNSEN